MSFYVSKTRAGFIVMSLAVAALPLTALAQSTGGDSYSLGAPVASNPSGFSAAAAKVFNPDTSVNFLGFFRKSNINTGDLIGRTSDVHNGFNFQEAEIQFFADVDPYFRANALFSIGPETSIDNVDTTKTPAVVTKKSGFGIAPEEVFIESISLPIVTARVGKFKAALGKHNTLHTHAFPFIDAPLINQHLLGPEGLNETGVSASALIPAVPWFLEVTGQVLSNNNDVLYNSPNAGDVSGVAQIKNLWDLSDDTTLEWSMFATQGHNAAERTSQVFGTDFIIKWRPAVGGKYSALIFANEYLNGNSPGTGFNVGPSDAISNGERLDGLASWVQYQFAERWWIQGRVEWEGLTQSDTLPTRTKQSALLGFFPSEFSGFRLQYDHLVASSTPNPVEHAVTLQWNITIGVHPAHTY